MPKFKDLTGQKFGRLTAIEPFFKNNRTYWLCKCDCGNEKLIEAGHLKDGHSKSCGCLKSELSRIKINEIRKTKATPNHYEKPQRDFIYCILPNCNDKVLIDKDDYDKVSKIRWYKTANGYVRGNGSSGTFKSVLIHQLILDRIGVKDGMEIDHINGNKLDNRKCNLRVVNRVQNSRNKNIIKTNTSGYAGVSYDKERKYWESYITVNYKKIHLGYYKNKDEAIKARKEAEEKYFGEYKYKGDN